MIEAYLGEAPRKRRRDACLRLTDLAVSYGSITALHDVSLRVATGDIVTLDRRQRRGQIDHACARSPGYCKAQQGSIKCEGEEIANAAAAQDRGAGHFAMCPKGG